MTDLRNATWRKIEWNVGQSVSAAKFVSNRVVTSKYTKVTFLPKNLLEQFHKQANLYFLLMSIVMYIGEKTTLFVGTIKAFSTAGMLGMMMTVSGVVAALDDLHRKKADDEMNNRPTRVYDKTDRDTTEIAWEQVRVGDVLKISKK